MSFDANDLCRLPGGPEMLAAGINDALKKGNPDRGKSARASKDDLARQAKPSSIKYPGKGDEVKGNAAYADMGADAIRPDKDEEAVVDKPSPRERLLALTVKEDYVAMIGNETWLFRNLIIKNQIVVIVAKSGGSKTTISFDFVAPWIIEHHGMSGYYFDLDSPASDHPGCSNGHRR